VIHPRDTIYVPPAEQGTYYMGGHVTRPGAYTLNGQRVTLKQAIIAASMLDPLAIPQRTDVVRRLGPDREVWVRVDLSKLFAGTQPDVYIKPDDQVLVGTNAIAPYLAAFRNAFRITYGAGFIYDRNFAYDKNVFGSGGL
jgi:protein involved in polysaccharide export with SLBB domain